MTRWEKNRRGPDKSKSVLQELLSGSDLLELKRRPGLRGSEGGQMVAPRPRVTPNLPGSAPTSSPPTGRSITLIASARGASSAADKWVSSATRARVYTCVYARGNPRRVRALSPHHMVKVSI